MHLDSHLLYEIARRAETEVRLRENSMHRYIVPESRRDRNTNNTDEVVHLLRSEALFLSGLPCSYTYSCSQFASTRRN